MARASKRKALTRRARATPKKKVGARVARRPAHPASAAAAETPPVPAPDASAAARHVPTLQELFGGQRPVSFSRGLEPAFLLIEREVMERLRLRASALGLGGYDSLVKRILREHVHEY